MKKNTWQEHTAIGLENSLGYIRKWLVFVASRNYSSLDDRVESSNIFSFYSWTSRIERIVLPPINYFC